MFRFGLFQATLFTFFVNWVLCVDALYLLFVMCLAQINDQEDLVLQPSHRNQPHIP